MGRVLLELIMIKYHHGHLHVILVSSMIPVLQSKKNVNLNKFSRKSVNPYLLFSRMIKIVTDSSKVKARHRLDASRLS